MILTFAYLHVSMIISISIEVVSPYLQIKISYSVHSPMPISFLLPFFRWKTLKYWVFALFPQNTPKFLPFPQNPAQPWKREKTGIDFLIIAQIADIIEASVWLEHIKLLERKAEKGIWWNNRSLRACGENSGVFRKILPIFLKSSYSSKLIIPHRGAKNKFLQTREYAPNSY